MKEKIIEIGKAYGIYAVVGLGCGAVGFAVAKYKNHKEEKKEGESK